MTLEHAANAIIFVGHVARVPADDGERTVAAVHGEAAVVAS